MVWDRQQKESEAMRNQRLAENKKEMKYYLCKINQKQKKVNVKISGVVRDVRQKAEERKAGTQRQSTKALSTMELQ